MRINKKKRIFRQKLTENGLITTDEELDKFKTKQTTLKYRCNNENCKNPDFNVRLILF